MNLRIAAVLAAVAVLLGACFTSVTPLIDASNSAFPFATLTVRDDGGTEATIVRDGDHYVFTGEDDEGFDIFFQDFGAGLYLVQFQSIAEDGTLQSLYAVVAVDAAAQTLSIYRSIVRDEDFLNGISHCVQDGVDLYLACLTDGAPLIAIVRAAIAAGEAPEDIYAIARMD